MWPFVKQVRLLLQLVSTNSRKDEDTNGSTGNVVPAGCVGFFCFILTLRVKVKMNLEQHVERVDGVLRAAVELPQRPSGRVGMDTHRHHQSKLSITCRLQVYRIAHSTLGIIQSLWRTYIVEKGNVQTVAFTLPYGRSVLPISPQALTFTSVTGDAFILFRVPTSFGQTSYC